VSVLDRCVHGAHRRALYHPYLVATDAGILAMIAFSAWYAARTSDLSFARFALAFGLMQAGYLAIRAARRRFFGIASRSFLQDSVLFILPLYATASALLGNGVRSSLDLAGLDLPLGLAFIRVGCFLGGCCYGVPARWGVRYTRDVLRDARGCRRFTPGDEPSERVLPMQLFEAAFNAVAFVALVVWAPRGLVLPLYLAGYGVWRFVSDFWRVSSARPRRAGLSEAQWASLLVLAGAGAFVWLSR
jgi:phosphatidylglycerol:prolipoprotein diacylglycerol transferase